MVAHSDYIILASSHPGFFVCGRCGRFRYGKRKESGRINNRNWYKWTRSLRNISGVGQNSAEND